MTYQPVIASLVCDRVSNEFDRFIDRVAIDISTEYRLLSLIKACYKKSILVVERKLRTAKSSVKTPTKVGSF